MSNKDDATIGGFGDEWSRFDQSELAVAERQQIFADYFSVFPWAVLPAGSVGADIGCGSGRWALEAAPRVGHLHCVDPSDAIDVARRNCERLVNCSFHRATIDQLPFPDGSLDFLYSLGVLHHVPDTGAAIKSVVAKLKPGAPLLLYLYYAFDNRPFWFRALWHASNAARKVISRLPYGLRFAVSQVIAATVYWPLARTAKLLDRIGALPPSFPLAYYRDKSFYTLRTDALDRFGTRLEHRFTRVEIEKMLRSAGCTHIRFSDRMPFWCVSAIRKN